MRGRIYRILASCVAASALFSASALAGGEFSGTYKGDSLSIVLTPDAGGYVGEIQKGQEHFPIKAHEENGRLVGVFSTPDANFDFTANEDAGGLTLDTGGVRHVLQKTAVNPLKAIRPDAARANPAPAAKADPDALAGYTVVSSTDFGKAITVENPKATDVKSAFQSTFPDLARFFGEKPAILGVFEDAKDHRSAGASFTAHLNGQAVKGLVSLKIGEKGATIAVVYCKADAPAAEWNKLTAKPAAVGQAAEIKMREYQFPDGTGTIQIAEGWTTNSPSLMTGVQISGPGDQKINLAMGAEVVTADSPLVKIREQLAIQARQLGGPPPPPIQMLMAEFTDPATALKALMPQISQVSQAGGGPALAIDNIVSVNEIKPSLPGGKAAIIIYDVTKTTRGVARHYRSGNRFEMTPVGQGTWMLYASEVSAPRETYERDLPVMIAMAASLKENPQVIAVKTSINIAAANERFAAQQRANKELQDAFDAQNRHWEQNQLIQSRSNADFDEIIRGYRTVEDTTTGNRTSVDLGNVHEIVDHLNEYNPGRYKEIPLRDEMYPMPGH